MKLNPEQIADCMTDLMEFSKVMFKARKGSSMKENWHQQAICEALEKVVIGKTKRLIINIPPRSGKTELAVLNFIAWATGIFPDSEWIHASYSKRLAAANTYGVREIMRNEVYAQIFPAVKLRNDSTAKDEFRTVQGGVIYATGAEGSITGRGAGGMQGRFQGAIVIDDPHKPGEANSALMRQNVIDWFQQTMESRKNSPDTPIIVIMQRLHESDLAGWLLGGGNGEKWDHIVIPALDENDQSFWPEQFRTDDLHRQRASSSYMFAGQMMQQPAPAGGGIFKDEWWRYYSSLPEIEYLNIYADTAQKTGQENDYSVFELWAKCGGEIYLIDMIRGKWEAPQLLAQAKSFWDKHRQTYGAKLRHLKVEDKSSGTGLIQQLKQSGVPVNDIQRNRDKVSRAYDTAPLVESGRVYLPNGHTHLGDMLHELSTFPVGSHDDTVDPLMDAVDDMLISQPKRPTIRIGRRR